MCGFDLRVYWSTETLRKSLFCSLGGGSSEKGPLLASTAILVLKKVTSTGIPYFTLLAFHIMVKNENQKTLENQVISRVFAGGA